MSTQASHSQRGTSIESTRAGSCPICLRVRSAPCPSRLALLRAAASFLHANPFPHLHRSQAPIQLHDDRIDADDDDESAKPMGGCCNFSWPHNGRLSLAAPFDLPSIGHFSLQTHHSSATPFNIVQSARCKSRLCPASPNAVHHCPASTTSPHPAR